MPTKAKSKTETEAKKIARLKQELADLESGSKKQNDAEELADAKERLEGRAYVFNTAQTNWVHTSITLYLKVKRETFNNRLTVTSRCLSVANYAKPRGAYEIRRNDIRTSQDFRSVTELLLYSRGEIPAAQFLKIWKQAESLGDCVSKWLASEVSAPFTEPYDPDIRLPADEDELPELDIDTIDISNGGDRYLLPKQYQIRGPRYILTPRSKILGARMLNEEENKLMSGSHLYQECDMRYVSGRHEQIRRLRSALTGGLGGEDDESIG